MQRALGTDQNTAAESKFFCRAAFRLAHYADGLYRSIRQQLSSPDMATAKAVIDYKRQQACGARAYCLIASARAQKFVVCR
jgi:hypothetical protein